jgi:hypothetical protein
MISALRAVFRLPLIRLLLVNLAIGVFAAALLFGGLLALNPVGLTDLIRADRSPATALAMLLFGFVITFGSTAMGTAIMALGRDDDASGRRSRIGDGALPVPSRGGSSRA